MVFLFRTIIGSRENSSSGAIGRIKRALFDCTFMKYLNILVSTEDISLVRLQTMICIGGELIFENVNNLFLVIRSVVYNFLSILITINFVKAFDF